MTLIFVSFFLHIPGYSVVPPKDVKVQVQSLIVQEGANALLMCSCKADPPVSDYRWSYSQHGRTVHLHQHAHTVRVYNVTRDMRVRCSVRNLIGRGESPPTALNVQCNATEMTATLCCLYKHLDSSHIVTCATKTMYLHVPPWPISDTTVQTWNIVIWRNLEIHCFHLTLMMVCEADKKCKMKISLKKDFDISVLMIFFLTYFTSPHFALLPSDKPVIHRLSSSCALEGSEVLCRCSVDSNPRPAVTWSVNGSVPPADYNTSVTSRPDMLTAILRGRMDRPTRVVCFAFNAVGNDSLILLQEEGLFKAPLWH